MLQEINNFMNSLPAELKQAGLLTTRLRCGVLYRFIGG